ncbi:MAG: DNA polymerase III subunit alpha [Saprospiraceae bacterium]
MPEFLHLHSHTQYSLLDGASEIGTMMDKAVADGMKGVALTDHGNMFGAFKFVAEAEKRGLKPMIGCEFYLVENRFKQSFAKAKGERDKRYHQLMLAKNQKGYQNLAKLCSLGFIEGLYGKYPRIDKTLVEKYHEGVIATSCCLGAEIPQAIIQGDLKLAEEKLKWWLNIFGEDYYIELMRHRGLDDLDIYNKMGKRVFSGVSQEDVNQELIKLARKYNVKMIATNDSHYVEEEDWESHDILLCVNTGKSLADDNRFKFSSSDYYFKTQSEMSALFSDLPEAIDNTMDVYSKIEPVKLARDILLPAFPMPERFKTQDDYLRHLTYEGARKRYGTLTPKITERLDFELDVIAKSGYPGYFLIVQDFTTVAREIGVWVGPGRGSAAGSVVAYCVGITNVDPIKYDLLFERFLNPERVSMPDIDIDFDDEGRQKIIDYVIDKYGQRQVAQIITYGTMAAKSSIQDVCRVMDIPLPEVDAIKKSMPDHLSVSLKKLLAKGDVHPKLKGKLNSEELEKAYNFRAMAEADDETGHIIRTAKKLEGSIRNTGIHACGVVITPDDITNYVPVKTDKKSDMLVSQFDNSVAEDAGLLKMDFLGLKTLTIIKHAIGHVKKTHGIDIDPDEIPLTDKPTYELFQRGETVGVFQYESAGMQKYMKELVPTEFSDLIAMNALYRPGPLEYIPEFIERKQGRKPVVYDLDAMEEYLAETYGITVYQEQVMLLSQKLANFSKGQADMLRKGMGKKKKKLIDQLYPIFIEGGESNGHDKKTLDKVWKDWEAFASYAFNKSHSTCYAFIAFQTAYLKANYPAEFMASVLTHNKNDISKVKFFLEECNRMGIEVLGPNINESEMNFTVNNEGKIRFGMSGLKGVGEGPVADILAEREKGDFKNIFDFFRRLSGGKSINKRVVESLVLGGGFDLFPEMHRAQYFVPSDKYDTFLEHLLKYGAAYASQLVSAATSLFGVSDDIMIPEPKIPQSEEWGLITKLNKEKDVTGIFISGHPLDDYKIEIKNFTTCSLNEMNKYETGKAKINIAGMIVNPQHRISKKGTGWGSFELQDFDGNRDFVLFGEDYINFKNYMNDGEAVYVTGKFRPSWRNKGEFDFKIEEMQLLETVGKNKIESIRLTIDIAKIDIKFVERLDALCKRKKGTNQAQHKLKMLFIDSANRQKLPLYSKTRKVNADNEFIEALEKMGVKYKVNA